MEMAQGLLQEEKKKRAPQIGRNLRRLYFLSDFFCHEELTTSKVIGHRGSNSVIISLLNCNCSQVPQIFAGSFVRFYLPMRAKETVKSRGTCE